MDMSSEGVGSAAFALADAARGFVAAAFGFADAGRATAEDEAEAFADLGADAAVAEFFLEAEAAAVVFLGAAVFFFDASLGAAAAGATFSASNSIGKSKPESLPPRSASASSRSIESLLQVLACERGWEVKNEE